uniref:Mediator of RNA polymerase II transcription subunit 8 n=1 Tax=Angiostrongylus cantonensis TaxID=6313 RepID=A0A0K0D718_ANGCA
MNTAICYLEVKVLEAKKLIEELLYMLDMQEKVPWCVHSFRANLSKPRKFQGHEDHGALLRSHVLVPQRLQLEPDAQLQALTSYRVHSWNHDVVPDYLRTKLNPDMESEELLLEQDRNQKGKLYWCSDVFLFFVEVKLEAVFVGATKEYFLAFFSGQDVISKQITHLNKYVDLLLQSLHSSDRAHNENLTEKVR